jgi:SAM-dependent methyltransferase
LATLNNQIKDKWNRYYDSNVKSPPPPSEVLFYNQHLLPTKGIALDLACGHGSNAICLAKNGLQVSAWDISELALEKLSFRLKEFDLIINCEIRDVLQLPPKPNTFDVIVVSRFFDRKLMKYIQRAIKSNGLVFYQTFIKDRIEQSGPKNPNYQLNVNELLDFFKDWKLIYYREEGRVGNLESGFRNQAMIISQKI